MQSWLSYQAAIYMGGMISMKWSAAAFVQWFVATRIFEGTIAFCPRILSLASFSTKNAVYLPRQDIIKSVEAEKYCEIHRSRKTTSRTDKVKIHRYQVDRRLLWSNAFCIARLLRKKLHGTISQLFYSHFHSFFRLFSSFCTFFTFSSRKFLPP